MKINDALQQLRESLEKHYVTGEKVMSDDGNAFYPFNIFLIATLNRSLGLVDGFHHLIKSKNYFTAFPLIRLQIDNCLRVYASTLVGDKNEFAYNVMKGNPICKQKDKSNQFLRDTYLKEKFSAFYQWAPKIYSDASGYIHLSEKHIINAMFIDVEDHSLNINLSPKAKYLSPNMYQEAIHNFQVVTDTLLDNIYPWGNPKENPLKQGEGLMKYLQM
jgi:hypothetical protein